MTDSDSPSALLERAAELIEQRAGEVHAPPWRIHDFAGEPIVLSKPSETDKKTWRNVVPDGAGSFDVAWIAMLGPQVAQPLVEWLRDAARRMALHPHLSPEGSTMQRTALAFARQILGES